MSNATTYSVLELSIAHLSEPELTMLHHQEFPTGGINATGTGWILVSAGDDDDDDLYFCDWLGGSWPGLRAARKLAQQRGCQLIEFDFTTPPCAELPVFAI